MDDMQAHKLDKFTRSVNMEVGEHINKIVEAAKDQSEKRLKRAEDKALEEAFNRIQKSVRELNRNTAECLHWRNKNAEWTLCVTGKSFQKLYLMM